MNSLAKVRYDFALCLYRDKLSSFSSKRNLLPRAFVLVARSCKLVKMAAAEVIRLANFEFITPSEYFSAAAKRFLKLEDFFYSDRRRLLNNTLPLYRDLHFGVNWLIFLNPMLHNTPKTIYKSKFQVFSQII